MKYIMKSVHIALLAMLLSMPTVQAKSGGQLGNGSKENAPGRLKKTNGTKSAKQYAPGQRKKTAGTKGSAKQYAPGQQNKNQDN